MAKQIKHQEKLDSFLKRIVKTSLIVFIAVIISKILGYVYRITIARNFGPETYGLFSLAVMLIGFFALFSALGLDSGVLRYASFFRGKNENNKIRYIFRLSLKIIISLALVTGILLFFFSDTISSEVFHNSHFSIFLKWFSLFLPVMAITGIFWSIIKSYEEIGWYTFLANILHNSLQVLILLSLLFLGLGEKSVIFSYNIGYLLTLLISFWLCWKKFPMIFEKSKTPLKEKRVIRSQLLSYSWPMMFLSVIFSIFFWIDSFTIGFFRGAEEVGIYNAAIPIASLLGIVPVLFTNLFFPLITKEYSKNNTKLIREISKQVAKWIFILNLPLLIIMILFPGTLVNVLFGPDYIAAESPLRFLAIGVFFYSIFIIAENLLSMAGKSKITLMNIILTSLFNLVLNIILVPIYGIDGAAFATMLSYLLWGLITLYQAKVYTSILPLRKKMLNILLVMIFPTAILIFVKQFIPVNLFTMVLQGVLFILIYFVLLLLTGCLDKNDLMIVNSIKKKFGINSKI